MKKKLNPINIDTLDIQKKRARLSAVSAFHDAYAHAHEAYGMTKKEFAERIGMKPSHFSRILSGSQNVTVETSEAVLRALNHRLSVTAVPLDEIDAINTNRYSRNGDFVVSYGHSDAKPHRKFAFTNEMAE